MCALLFAVCIGMGLGRAWTGMDVGRAGKGLRGSHGPSMGFLWAVGVVWAWTGPGMDTAWDPRPGRVPQIFALTCDFRIAHFRKKS